MKRLTIALAALSMSPLAFGQISDLQPGRNFPTGPNAFGGGRSENIDVGDVDNDGDYDVVVANGGDGSAQANVIFINNGGAQGGTTGTFSNQTGTRFAGIPNDTSRDCEFADVDGDFDLDIYISNRGTTVNGGEVSRLYENQGGIQAGAPGFFSEQTNAFWGSLSSVPLSRQVFGGNAGPWRDFSCDCDFGDLDDDGDLDLFHSSYGPNINGNEDSRIFLNDGDGLFDELSPWANAGADIKLHTLDIDLVDLDGDFDMDVWGSSRDSQGRVYRNNLTLGSGWTGTPFTDITQTALLDTGVIFSGDNYESEFGDVDGDGDFDVYMKNWNGFTDRIARNNGDMTFTQMNAWIKGDPSNDENEVDFLDYDNDGDLDALLANFSGTNHLYQNGVNDGVPFNQGIFHRNNPTAAGSLAQWNELPASGNGGTTLDGECADMDLDGDTDILLANDGNAQNKYFENVLGVPDTHAPTFALITNQGNKSDGTDTVIRAQLRDNTNYYVINYYSTNLFYSVNGGDETCVQMFSQGSQQFRGVIPGELNGVVSYRVETVDEAGNTAVSSTFNYTQTSSSTTVWQNLGCGTNGVRGVPYLAGVGTMAPLSINKIHLIDAAPSALTNLFMSISSTPANFKGGVLYTVPIIVTLGLITDPAGQISFGFQWPSGIPAGAALWWQYAIQDAAAQGGVSVSNAIKSNTL